MPTGHRRPRPRPRVVVLLGQRVADRGELVLWSPAVVVLRSDANGSRPTIRTYALSRFRVEVEPCPGRKMITLSVGQEPIGEGPI